MSQSAATFGEKLENNNNPDFFQLLLLLLLLKITWMLVPDERICLGSKMQKVLVLDRRKPLNVCILNSRITH